MRALEFIAGHVTYNLAYSYKFQLKTTIYLFSAFHNCGVLIIFTYT